LEATATTSVNSDGRKRGQRLDSPDDNDNDNDAKKMAGGSDSGGLPQPAVVGDAKDNGNNKTKAIEEHRRKFDEIMGRGMADTDSEFGGPAAKSVRMEASPQLSRISGGNNGNGNGDGNGNGVNCKDNDGNHNGNHNDSSGNDDSGQQ